MRYAIVIQIKKKSFIIDFFFFLGGEISYFKSKRVVENSYSISLGNFVLDLWGI